MIPTSHPPRAALDQLLAGDINDRQLQRWVIAHLLRRCDACEGYLRGEAHPDLAAATEAFTKAADGILAAGLGRVATGIPAIQDDRLAAAACWAILRATGEPTERLRLATTDPRFHRPAVAARILDEIRHEDEPGPDPDSEITPRESVELALVILERLAAGAHPPSQVNDLRTRAWMVEADTLRLYGRPDDARTYVQKALDAQEAGSGDARERAGLRCLEADIDLEQGDTAAAVARLRRALATYRLLGERHEAGRVLHRLSQIVGYERPIDGVTTAERALTLIEPGRDLPLDLAARHGLIWFLNDGGMSWQALELLEATRRLYRQLTDTLPHRLLPWLEARICRRLGELSGAERGLEIAWSGLRGSHYHQEAALIGLDLAEVRLVGGGTRQAVQVLAEVLDCLQKWWSMHPEGLAAWSRVTAAVEGGVGGGGEGEGQGREAAAMLREAGLYFRRWWRRPAPFLA